MLSENGRQGKIEASEPSFSIDFTELRDGIALTPEHLFAGAYAACYHSALLAAAERAHQTIIGSTVIGTAQLNEDEHGGYELAFELRASLPGVSASEGEHLMHEAHRTCPYSKAVRQNIPVKLTLD